MDGTGMLTYDQTATIVGGTGRFEGATGQAHATGATTPDFSSYYGDFTGWIDY